MIVVDASVLAVALGDDGVTGQRARQRLRDETLAAPELVDLEVMSVWRRRVHAGLMTPQRAAAGIAALSELPMRRASHRWFSPRIWELRQTITVYDAAYVALAEKLGAILATADARLCRAPGPTCGFELLT